MRAPLGDHPACRGSTEPLPSRLHIFYPFTRPFFVRQDISWPAVCPSSFYPGLLVGEFCGFSFPFLGALTSLTRRVSSPETPPRPRSIYRLSFQRSNRRRPDVHPPPHRWRTPAFSRFFALFLCLPFLSSAVPGSAPIGRACGAEGGQLGSSCPCPASVSRIPAPADFCAEAKILSPDWGSKWAAQSVLLGKGGGGSRLPPKRPS